MNMTEWMGSTLEHHGALSLFFITLLEGFGIPLPTEVVLPLAGVLVNRGIIRLSSAIAAALAGQVIGSVLVYLLGQFGGRPLLQRCGRFIRQHELDRIERWFNRHGERVVFITRLFPGARTLVSLSAGISGMPIKRFALYTSAGILLWTGFLIVVGMKAGRAWERWSGYLHVIMVIIGIAAAVYLAFIAWRKLKRKR